jgi:hypothetical protein
VVLVPVLGVTFLVLVLVVVPALVVCRDLARARPDVEYSGADE